MRSRTPLFARLILALLPLVVAASESIGISVRDAWVRESPPGSDMTAGYMALQNNTSRRQALVAASSPQYETVMIHRTVEKGSMTGMVHVPQVELAPSMRLKFAPGGYHLMLMNPKQRLRAGESVVINLEFRGGLVQAVTFEVRK